MFEVQAQRAQVYVRVKPTDNFAANNIQLSSDNKSLIIHGNPDRYKYPGGETINNQVADWDFRLKKYYSK